MSEPLVPDIVEAIAVIYGSFAQPKPLTRKQSYLQIINGVKQSTFYDCAAEVVVGSFCDFPFDIGIDSWIDPGTGLHYFKPCGRTFGSLRSQADFAYDGFKELFFKLHGNEYLQMYDSFLYPVNKTNSADDWEAKCCLSLPLAEGLTAVASGTDAEGFIWEVGKRGGTSQYPLRLPVHNHELQQTKHAHIFNQEPHLHVLEGETYDMNAAESGSGSGSAKDALANITTPSSINIEMEPQNTDVKALPSGIISNKMQIQNAGYGMEKMIFSGVIDG